MKFCISCLVDLSDFPFHFISEIKTFTADFSKELWSFTQLIGNICCTNFLTLNKKFLYPFRFKQMFKRVLLGRTWFNFNPSVRITAFTINWIWAIEIFWVKFRFLELIVTIVKFNLLQVLFAEILQKSIVIQSDRSRFQVELIRQLDDATWNDRLILVVYLNFSNCSKIIFLVNKIIKIINTCSKCF